MGAAAAFVTTREDPEINQPTIDYVANYVRDETRRPASQANQDMVIPSTAPTNTSSA